MNKQKKHTEEKTLNFANAGFWDFTSWNAYGRWQPTLKTVRANNEKRADLDRKYGEFVTFRLVGFREMMTIYWNRLKLYLTNRYDYKLRSEHVTRYTWHGNSLPAERKPVVYRKLKKAQEKFAFKNK